MVGLAKTKARHRSCGSNSCKTPELHGTPIPMQTAVVLGGLL